MADADTLIAWRFGRFLLEPSRRSLTADGAPVPLSSRAFDILTLLVEERGRILSKEEILATVWRGLAVEENNLAVQMSALRRALSDRPGAPQMIVTVPGQGYRFVAPVLAPAMDPPPAERTHAQPERRESFAGDLSQPIQTEPLHTRMFDRPSHSHDVDRAHASELAVAPSVPAGAVWRRISRRAAFGIAAAASAVAVILVLSWRQPAAPRLSIAVLPFRNLSGDIEQNYLADAISDDLTTDLSHIPGSVVIARTSADVYKKRAVDAVAVGQALHVRYLLEGSLRIDGGVDHVNAQLIDAEHDTHVWASRFDVDRADITRVQSQIVAQIASALRLSLIEAEATRSIHERPDDPDAADLFLRARYLLKDQQRIEDFDAAQKLLDQALQIEPEFTDAIATSAITLLRRMTMFDDPREVENFAKARALVRHAMTLAPRNPLVLNANGLLMRVGGHCDEASAAARSALSINPNYVDARNLLAICARQLGHMDEMIREVKEIIARDPVGAGQMSRYEKIGFGYLMLGKPDVALGWLQKARSGALLLDRKAAFGWQQFTFLYLIAAYTELGNAEQAAEIRQLYEKFWPRASIWQMLSYDTHAISALPGYRRYEDALKAAGLRAFNPENYDEGIAQSAEPVLSVDSDPTPHAVPGAATITAAALHGMIDHGPAPVILDFGRGAAIVPGADWMWSGGVGADQSLILNGERVRHAVETHAPVVIMGDGPLGWRSYNAVLRFIAQTGHTNVMWFRGGEEAWKQAGYASIDRRTP